MGFRKKSRNLSKIRGKYFQGVIITFSWVKKVFLESQFQEIYLKLYPPSLKLNLTYTENPQKAALYVILMYSLHKRLNGNLASLSRKASVSSSWVNQTYMNLCLNRLSLMS